MTWRTVRGGGQSGVRRGFTLVELLVVIGIIAVLIAILMPALSRVQSQALATACASNERQVVIAATAYANDWRNQLPTQNGVANVTSGITWHLSDCPRLPIVGFDTSTIVEPLGAIYDTTTTSGVPATSGIGGWAFMLRDYLSNNVEVTVCPDGWWSTEQMFEPADVLSVPPLYALRRRTFPLPGPVFTDPLTGQGGYLWLPHREGQPASSTECSCEAACPAGDQVDHRRNVARTSRSKPEMLVTADLILWHDQPGFPMQLLANHVGVDTRGAAIRSSDASPFIDDPVSANDADELPLGTNVARVDGRTTWVPFQETCVYRFAVMGIPAPPRLLAYHMW